MLELSARYRRLARRDADKALSEDQPDRIDMLDMLGGGMERD